MSMTEEDKQLLLKDLCARLSYGVKVKIFDNDVLPYDSEEGFIVGKENIKDDYFVIQCSRYSWNLSYNNIKPYLRPISSMTKEEMEEYSVFFNYDGIEYPSEYVDWLNAHHFDHRGLIPMGLALEAPEDMYKTK